MTLNVGQGAIRAGPARSQRQERDNKETAQEARGKYNRDDRLPRIMLELLGEEPDLTVGDNEPYRISDATDYTIPVHGEGRGVVHVEIEVRHDGIESAHGREQWAARLARALERAAERLGGVS